MSMWQRFTESARRAIFYAQEEAQRLGEAYVSAEHILLALVRDNDTVAARVLTTLGASLTEIKCEVENLLPGAHDKPSQETTLSPQARRIIHLAKLEAGDLKSDALGTEHLLLGIIRDDDAPAGRVLAKLGVDLQTARNAIVQLRSANPQAATEAPLDTSANPRKASSIREQSALIVVDLQDTFLAPIKDKERVLSRSGFIIEVARLLHVPYLVTEQYAARMGRTNEHIRSLLGETAALDKMCFSGFGLQEFREAFYALGKRQAVIVGIETHICVTQTVLDSLDRGISCFVCADAVSARLPDAHDIALQRMRDAGAVITHTESVAYEWLENAGTDDFKAALEIIKRYNS